MQHWSERLKKAMKAKGWTAAELHRRSGVEVERIYKYLQGKVEAPRSPVLDDLSAALGVQPLWLSHAVEAVEALRRIPIVALSALAGLKKPGDLAEQVRDAERVAVPAIAEVGPNAVAVTLEDDSMAPKYPRGLMVVCDPDDPVRPGRYVIAISTLANGPVFRRFRAKDASGTKGDLVAENPDFPTIPMRSARDGFIVGACSMVFHKLP